MSVDFLEGLDIGARCLEDAQTEEPEHRHQGEAVDIGRSPACSGIGHHIAVQDCGRRDPGGEADLG